MTLLTQLKEYRMRRFFSNNCAWTKECKKEYAALMYLINNLMAVHDKPISKKDVIHNEIHNSNIGRRFQEEAINAMYDEQDDYHTGF